MQLPTRFALNNLTQKIGDATKLLVGVHKDLVQGILQIY